MEKTCSLFKENYLHFFCIWLKLLGLVRAKLWEGDLGARVDCIWRALASLLWGNRGAWPGQERPPLVVGVQIPSLSLWLYFRLSLRSLGLSGGCWWLLSAGGSGQELTHSLEAKWCEAGADVSSCSSEVCYGVTALWDIWRVIGRKVKGRAFGDHLASVRNWARSI